jgi:hypothetical protein
MSTDPVITGPKKLSRTGRTNTMVGMASSMALPSGGLKSLAKNKPRTANRNSIDLSGINDKLVNMLKGDDNLFEKQFISESKKLPILMKDQKFDGSNTYINVGTKGNFTFDMDDPIFNLDRPCPGAARYKNVKMKDINLPVQQCQVC